MPPPLSSCPFQSFSFSADDRTPVDDLLSAVAGPSDWLDTVAHLHISIPNALSRSRVVGDVHEDQIGCNSEMKLGEVVN